MAEAPSFSLDLPDPESDSISSMEFLARIEEAWAICDRFDLQTEIWRGRILKAVRDRERRGGEGRGGGPHLEHRCGSARKQLRERGGPDRQSAAPGLINRSQRSSARSRSGQSDGGPAWWGGLG